MINTLAMLYTLNCYLLTDDAEYVMESRQRGRPRYVVEDMLKERDHPKVYNYMIGTAYAIEIKPTVAEQQQEVAKFADRYYRVCNHLKEE